MTRIEYVRGMQKRRAFHADVDECRLHARKHPRHASLVDVADQSAAAGALEKHLLQHAVLDHRGARFMSARIDQNFSAHQVCPRPAASATSPASRNRSAVSNNGSPLPPTAPPPTPPLHITPPPRP